MNIKQLHIAIQQELQRINANATSVFRPPEIDLAINQEVRKFVKQHYVPEGNKYLEGFEQSSKRIEDLRKLVVPDYRDTTFVSPFESNVVKFPLPSDHFLLTRGRAEVVTDGCNSAISKGIKTNTFSYTLIPIDFTNDIEGQLNSFSITADGTNITSSVYRSNVATSFWFPEDSYDFLRSLEEETKNNISSSIHKEVYKNVSVENALIVVIPDTVSVVQLSFDDGNNSVTKNYSKTEGDIKTKTYTTYAFDPDSAADSDPVRSYNRGRYSQIHDIDKLMGDPHNTTRPKAPLFTVRDNYIDIYQDDEFFVSSFVIDYIRMPKRVSYERNQDLELPEHVHDEIAKSTASYLAAMAADQRYEFLEKESRDSE